MDEVIGDMNNTDDVAQLGRPVLLELMVAGKHKVASKRLVLLRRLAKRWKLLTEAKIDQREL